MTKQNMANLVGTIGCLAFIFFAILCFNFKVLDMSKQSNTSYNYSQISK